VEERILYEQLTPRRFRKRLARAPIAYLPLGTLEWHGEHLPLGSDGLQAQGFFKALAKEAGGIVLPMLFVGPDRHLEKGGRHYYGMDVFGFSEERPEQLPGSAYWVEEPLFKSLLLSILGQLARAGFKIVVAHGHGPSTGRFIEYSKEWERELSLRLFACWPEAGQDRALGIQTDHAAANETSLMMALHGELVEMKNLDPDPDLWPIAVNGEDPRIHASRERGKKALSLNVARLAAVLKQTLTEIQGC
jgi:creatinine amidohydrolase